MASLRETDQAGLIDLYSGWRFGRLVNKKAEIRLIPFDHHRDHIASSKDSASTRYNMTRSSFQCGKNCSGRQVKVFDPAAIHRGSWLD